jgi:hypothetical protein
MDVCQKKKAFRAHCDHEDLKEVVITLFMQLIPASDTAGRAVLLRVLGNPAPDFEKSFITIETQYA